MTRVGYDDVTLPETDTAKVSIDAEGADEDVVEKVAMHARNEAVKALQAFDTGKHPSECEGTPVGIRWYDVLDLEPPSYPNGIYLIADTPKSATPLAVEDGSGDRALLREALAENDVAGFGASNDYPDVRRYVKDQIASDEDDDGAPVADVIEAAAEEFTLGTAIDVLRDLHRTGEVYAPTKTTLRRT